eukprot:TRINITY_DN4832_c0_g1_i1.p1 TRINITY_DN4832_c0_g1~~TRINITY_DN4832_c0_g1_i1.p1  ORF type:complete len:126 (-),score=19.05 TRINITY_DN4832_c0_g1_i1:232-609(-)
MCIRDRYLNGTSHITHVHELAACSGVFYSQVAEGSPTPIEFSDPRGLSSMWIDTTKKEKEPLAPFHNRISFFPRAGDMVLFPSYLPHRIESHSASSNKGARVAWAFNLEGGVDTWARVVTAQKPN